MTPRLALAGSLVLSACAGAQRPVPAEVIEPSEPSAKSEPFELELPPVPSSICIAPFELEHLRLGVELDYLALRSGRSLSYEMGVPCSKHTSVPCLQRLGQLEQTHLRRSFIGTSGDDVRVFQTRAELLELFGAIDTPHEALWLLNADGYAMVGCSLSTKDGPFQLDVQRRSDPCTGSSHVWLLIDARVAVHPDGAIETLSESKREIACATIDDLVMEGRRPPGLLARPHSLGASWLGRRFARAAQDEAASVVAFDRLANELMQLAAPRMLVAGARRAAREELRHAMQMQRLAARFGGRMRPAVIERSQPRDLFALALDNAIEGCVHETSAAFRIAHQASFSRDADVRRTLGSIARDELRHAAWSFQLAAWAKPRLRASERAEIARRQERALEQLAEHRDESTPEEGQSIVGLPDERGARALFDALYSLA
jgi:hypothetical protein